MKFLIQKKTKCNSLLEFFILSMLVAFFLSKFCGYLIDSVELKPEALDIWHMCYILQQQIMRIIGLSSGGIWEGMTFYPFNTVSLLFDEPSWGVSLLVAPIWVFSKNIFPIFRLGGLLSLFLGWVFTYYFVRNLGGSRIWSFYAGAMSCLSGVSLILISGQYCFWPFFLVPLLGIVTLKIFSTSKLYWGMLWGGGFGYLSWASAHIFVMGGSFLVLFILWNLLFRNRSKKIMLALLIAFVSSSVISGIVFGYMYFIHKEFGFSRGYYQLYWYASNWENLIYRHWPPVPFNPIAKTHLWEYLKTNAKGEVNIGMSFLLLLSALVIFIKRLKGVNLKQVFNKHAGYMGIGVIIISILLASLNMYSLIAKCKQVKISFPGMDFNFTYIFYVMGGIIIYVLRHRIKLAIKNLDFFFLLLAFFFGFLSFGPYYVTNDGLSVAAPFAFLQYHVPGFSGIQATARWGLLLAFALPIAVAIFLSEHLRTLGAKVFAALFIMISILEVVPGFQISEFEIPKPYKWTPREVDVFLKNRHDKGAVLELASYPATQELDFTSHNSLGYIVFSSLEHRKPLVTGYGLCPSVTYKYLFNPEEKRLSLEVINTLRKFGARYWVFHIDDWLLEELELLKNSTGELKKIAELDNGKTLVFEDPAPKVSVGRFDVF